MKLKTAQESRVISLSPILCVEAIEPCLPFWTERLGFEVVARVPEAGKIEFAMLARDGVTLMLQTRDSIGADMPALTAGGASLPAGQLLYFKVEKLEPYEKALEGVPVVVPKRHTFYGAWEIVVREPGGSLVCISEHEEG